MKLTSAIMLCIVTTLLLLIESKKLKSVFPCILRTLALSLDGWVTTGPTTLLRITPLMVCIAWVGWHTLSRSILLSALRLSLLLLMRQRFQILGNVIQLIQIKCAFSSSTLQSTTESIQQKKTVSKSNANAPWMEIKAIARTFWEQPNTVSSSRSSSMC
jgi:hypothetical protein